MSRPSPLRTALVASSFVMGSLFAGAATPQLRFDTPVSDGQSGYTAVKAPVDMRGADVFARSFIVQSVAELGASEEVSGKEFVPTPNPGLGNFDFRKYGFSFSLSEGYDDNVYTSSFDKQGSAFTSASLGFVYGLTTGTNSIQITAGAGGQYYSDRVDNFDPQFNLSVVFAHAFSKKFRLDIAAVFAYQAEPDFRTGIGQNGRAGDYFYGQIALDLSQKWTRRLSTVYSYTVRGVYYADNTFRGGDDRLENTVGLQLRYLINPSLTLAAEYRFEYDSYDDTARDASIHYVLAGVDFTVNSRLTGSVRVGGQFLDSDVAGQNTSPFLESTFTYKAGENTSVSWLNRYGFEQSDRVGATNQQTYRTGLDVSHHFGTKIIGTLGAYYTYTTYDDDIINNEQTIDLSGRIVYVINRTFSLNAGYNYTNVISDDIFSEYERNRVYLGATANF